MRRGRREGNIHTDLRPAPGAPILVLKEVVDAPTSEPPFHRTVSPTLWLVTPPVKRQSMDPCTWTACTCTSTGRCPAAGSKKSTAVVQQAAAGVIQQAAACARTGGATDGCRSTHLETTFWTRDLLSGSGDRLLRGQFCRSVMNRDVSGLKAEPHTSG
jgi:hypothetical protein